MVTEECRRPESQKKINTASTGSNQAATFFPAGPWYDQAILFGANGHAFNTADAFRRANCPFLTDLDSARTLPSTFSRADTVVGIAIDPQWM